jgi:hypothetical protein
MKKVLISIMLFYGCSKEYQIYDIDKGSEIKKHTIVDLSKILYLTPNHYSIVSDSSTFEKILKSIDSDKTYYLIYKSGYIPRYFDNPLGPYIEFLNVFESKNNNIKFGFEKNFKTYSSQLSDSCNLILVRKY